MEQRDLRRRSGVLADPRRSLHRRLDRRPRRDLALEPDRRLRGRRRPARLQADRGPSELDRDLRPHPRRPDDRPKHCGRARPAAGPQAICGAVVGRLTAGFALAAGGFVSAATWFVLARSGASSAPLLSLLLTHRRPSRQRLDRPRGAHRPCGARAAGAFARAHARPAARPPRARAHRRRPRLLGVRACRPREPGRPE